MKYRRPQRNDYERLAIRVDKNVERVERYLDARHHVEYCLP